MTDAIKPAYMGEAMLLGWGESDTAGRWVKFQLPEDCGPLHPFKGIKKKQFMEIVAVMKDENEQPISRTNAVTIEHAPSTAPDTAPPVGPAEAAGEGQDTRRSFDSLPRSQQAAIKCQDQDFFDWLSKLPEFNEVARNVGASLSWNAMADAVVKFSLNVKSKRELDTDPSKAEAWDRMLASFKYREQVR